MGKPLRKAKERLKMRQDDWESRFSDDPARKRPGSMNKKKRVGIAKK